VILILSKKFNFSHVATNGKKHLALNNMY